MLNGALPTFVVSGGVALVLLRGLFDAACFSAVGTLLFWTQLLGRARGAMPHRDAAALDARLLSLARLSLLASLLAAFAWLLGETGSIADIDGLARRLAIVPTVLAATRFGHLIMAQILALAFAIPMLARRPSIVRRRCALALAAACLLLQAGHGHAMAMVTERDLLLPSEIVHLLAGAAWLGGLLPLLLTIRLTPPRAGAAAARSFSGLGKGCVVAVAATAMLQGWVLVGSVPALLGTAHGWIAGVKTLLLAVLLGFAWVNRYRLAPGLRGDRPELARRRLTRSIAIQSGFGLLVVLAAGLLASLPPGMHEQPVWPFTLRPSLVTVDEDAGFRQEVLIALAALAGALVLAVVGLLLRGRRRIACVAVAVLVAVPAVPHLDLLLVEASPTSFYRSPTGFAVGSIVQGAALYTTHCASCHGADGRGDGALAATLPVPPADLTAFHLWMHDDGRLFWWLTHGIVAPDGRQAMPGFAQALSVDQRWAVIDFIRARNAGLVRRATGAWPLPLQAPQVQARCAGDRTVTQTELRGRIVRLVFGGMSVPAAPDVTTVRVDPGPAARPDATTCIADDRSITAAYAILTGRDAASLAGMQLLIDTGGWLRQLLPTGDAAALSRAVAAVRTHPPGAAAVSMQMSM